MESKSNPTNNAAFPPAKAGGSVKEDTMTITERKSGNVTILDLEGNIELGEGDVLFKSKVDELLESGENKIVVNLSAVPYMDAGGLGEIVRRYTATHRSGGKLKLLNATKRVADLLTITKLITVFEIYEDEDAAIASFS